MQPSLFDSSDADSPADPPGSPPAPSSGVVVREVDCRTVLNRTSLGDYSLNCYTGCAHGCAYCYARFMQRFHPHDEPWGAFVDVKRNALDVLRRQLRRAPPGEVFLSSACDGWQPIEAERRLTRRACAMLLEHGFRLHVLTKSALVLRDLDVFAGKDVRLGVTLTALDAGLAALWEPRAWSPAERIEVLRAARRAGMATAVMFGPLLPSLCDDAESLHALFAVAAELGVDKIWVDAINPRPRVWPAVAALLRSRYSGLLETYRRILFDRARRSEYLAALRRRVDEVARRAGMAGRTSACF